MYNVNQGTTRSPNTLYVHDTINFKSLAPLHTIYDHYRNYLAVHLHSLHTYTNDNINKY